MGFRVRVRLANRSPSPNLLNVLIQQVQQRQLQVDRHVDQQAVDALAHLARVRVRVRVRVDEQVRVSTGAPSRACRATRARSS